VRIALGRLLRSAGYDVDLFASAQEFLSRLSDDPSSVSCLVVDLRMPEVSGIELLEALERDESPLSVVVISGHADTQSTVRAMKLGAVDFLAKPVDDRDLLSSVAAGITASADRRQAHAAQAQLRARFQGLTPREQDVCELVARGLLNKQIAYELGIVEKTVKVHRARVMEKLEVGSVAELVRMVDRMGAVKPRG
jgi:FixJ family two-component response regulator